VGGRAASCDRRTPDRHRFPGPVDIIRLGDADLQLALDEGEGLSSVAEWRTAHEEFWANDQHAHPGLDDDTPILVERFRLLAE
jgi:uncharacterized protein YhfF